MPGRGVGVVVVGGGVPEVGGWWWGVLHDDTYMTPFGWFDLQSRSAWKAVCNRNSQTLTRTDLAQGENLSFCQRQTGKRWFWVNAVQFVDSAVQQGAGVVFPGKAVQQGASAGRANWGGYLAGSTWADKQWSKGGPCQGPYRQMGGRVLCRAFWAVELQVAYTRGPTRRWGTSGAP